MDDSDRPERWAVSMKKQGRTEQETNMGLRDGDHPQSFFLGLVVCHGF